METLNVVKRDNICQILFGGDQVTCVIAVVQNDLEQTMTEKRTDYKDLYQL